jgi:hypothetical protein
MTSKYLTTVVLTVVFAWSAVMAALGQVAAVGALVPSLVLLLQQAMRVLAGEPRHGESAVLRPGRATDPALHADNAVTAPPDRPGVGAAGGEGAR